MVCRRCEQVYCSMSDALSVRMRTIGPEVDASLSYVVNALCVMIRSVNFTSPYMIIIDESCARVSG